MFWRESIGLGSGEASQEGGRGDVQNGVMCVDFRRRLGGNVMSARPVSSEVSSPTVSASLCDAPY